MTASMIRAANRIQELNRLNREIRTLRETVGETVETMAAARAEIERLREERDELRAALQYTQKALNNLVAELPSDESLADYEPALTIAEHADEMATAALARAKED